jgi:hypothetical protein
LRKEQEEEARIFDKMRELRNALHEADGRFNDATRSSPRSPLSRPPHPSQGVPMKPNLRESIPNLLKNYYQNYKLMFVN